MFRPIHLLPQLSDKKISSLRERWETVDGKRDYENIIEKIKAGAGEDFLQWNFQQGAYSVLKDEHDLRGIKFWKLDINFPHNDSFEAIDFSYAQVWHCKFADACFPQTNCNFCRFYNFELNKCLFAFADWYGSTFEKVRFIDCDFVEHNHFNNCRFINCFFSDNVFLDCSFDVQTKFSKNLRSKPNSGHTQSNTPRQAAGYAEVSLVSYESGTNVPDTFLTRTPWQATG